MIRDDGEASVVPLSNVSVIHQEGTEGEEKNPTVIVLQTEGQEEETHETPSGLNITEEIVGSLRTSSSRSNAEDIAAFISLSSGQVEESGDRIEGAVITIAETGEQQSPGDVNTIENIEIDVLPTSGENAELQKTILSENGKDEPIHIVKSHSEGSRPVAKKTSLRSHPSSSAKNVIVRSLAEKAKNDKRRGEKELPFLGEGNVPVNASEAEDKAYIQECDRQKKENYMLSLTAWTKRLPALANGVIEPFKKVEATLHKDLSKELGLETDKGIFFSLHQQGVAKGVRVVETGPEQIVVSGSLVELLASRDMILSEIEKIKGTCSLSTSVPSSSNKTCEVGVMCELIPSPPSARYASSAGLDRSARRYHSVLSRPISPEPRPHRKRSRRQLSLESKLKSSEKQEDVSRRRPDRSQSRRSESQTLRTLKIKLEKDHEEKQTEGDYLVPKESNHNVEILLGDLKMEPECDETIIVSSISNSDLGEESHEAEENISKPSSLLMHKDCDSYALPLVNKDTSGKNVEGRGQELRRRLEVESSNKENIKMDNSQFLYKPKEQVEDEDLDMEVEDHKIICEPEINMSEDQDDDLTKGHSAEEIKFKFSCQICSYKSMRENHFVKHMKLHDKGIALYRCNECSFVSIRASHLRRHKMSHAQQVLNCHLCSYTCDEQKLLAKHVRVKHQTPKPKQITSDVEPQALFECQECEYKTSWHYAYQRHRRTHSASKVVRIHTCPQCPYKTMRREHFLRHIKNVHQNHRPFLCDICGKAFKRQDALKQHHVTHYQSTGSGSSGQIGPYGFVCHICQKVCRSAAYLKEHMATHSEERSFLCEVCGASFKTRSVQRNHVQTIHRRPRSFTCPSCEKKFNTKYALRRHMKQHDTSLEDAEVLTSVNSGLRLCGLQPRGSYACARERIPAAAATLLPSPTNPPHTGSPARTLLPPPAAPPSASAYQITIDGQPAFILPHLDDQHAAVAEGDPALMEESNAVIVGADSPGGAGLRRLAGQGAASGAISVPVVPATVHIVNQDPLSSASGELIISSEQYQASQAASVVTSEPPTYVAPEHPGSTLLYLTGNFS